MRCALTEGPNADDQEDGRRQDRHESVDQPDRGAKDADKPPQQDPERDSEQQSSGDSMIWRGSVQGGQRCSGAAVCQMRSQLSAGLGTARYLGVSWISGVFLQSSQGEFVT